jgi:ribosomal-protein-alanine N-acetyltransferase
MKDFNSINKNYNLKRITLEKLSNKHLDDIHEYSINKDFFKFFEMEVYKKKIQTKRYIKTKLNDVKKKRALWWSIKLKNNRKVIGTICVHNINFLRKSCELGYGINPNYWGKRYFIEALQGVLKVINKKERFTRCQAITSKNNFSSIYGLIKCGFKTEGVLKKFYRHKKKMKNFDAIILAKTI